jgi:hypothetical protein
MDVEVFNWLFPELLALLPDIEKQRELYEVYKHESMKDGLHLASLTECAKCGQILLNDDLQSHSTSHGIENHFPGLNKSNSVKGAWSRM